MRENWKQFSLLVLVNAFVGGMVGLERTILPEIAETDFQLVAQSALFSFIIVFGFSKAISNYFAGKFAEKYGRKKMLITGWLFGLPVPFILMWAPDWNWIVGANVLLGINQGLAWSSNVIMKIDLAGEKDRGLAMGLNEFAGYLAVALIAYLTGYIASEFGLRPYPFYLGIFMAFVGLFLSVFFVKDTGYLVEKESESLTSYQNDKNLFLQTSWHDKSLFSISQGGLLTNFKDGVAWGAFPVYLMSYNFNLKEIGIIVSIYPFFWGLIQILTGKLSDYTGRKNMLVFGMFIQGLSLLMFASSNTFLLLLIASATLGIGTAMVYPTFLAAIADLVHPKDRAETVGIYRLWRDSGYAFGAIFASIIIYFSTIKLVIIATGLALLVSGVLINKNMKKI